MQVNGPQPPQGRYPQPVTYRPQTGAGVPINYRPGMPADSYRPGMPPRGPMGSPTMGQPQQDNYEYVSQKDVAFGVVGAVGGFFLAGAIGLTGPIGALIFGLAALGISSIGRAIKHSAAKKKAQQPPQQMPQPPQYPDPTQRAGGAYQHQNRYDYGQNPNPNQQRPDPRYRYPGQ